MKNENKQPVKRKSRKIFFRNLVFLLFMMSILSLGVLFFLNMLPISYFLGVVFFVLSFDIFMVYCILGRGWKKRFFGTILTVVMLFLFIIADVYALKTMDFLHKINKEGNFNTKNYSLVVLKSSNYEKLKELKKKEIGISKLEEDVGLKKAQNYLNKKVEITYKEEEDLTTLFHRLLDKEVDAILIEDAAKKMLEEEHPEFIGLEKIIHTFSIDVEMNDELVKNVDITNSAFNFFISGIDSYGKITSVARSDVNMLVSINPNTNKVLITSIPRDYYVKLHGINTTYNDKLTHAGIHGIDTSVKTVEDLLDIDINYYVKVNFTSLVELVNKLGGIDVEVDTPFRAYYQEDGKIINYAFKKGTNHLNGAQALAFSRERKSLALGDIARVNHQQMVMEGILNKVLSKSIITKYTELLESLEGRFITNFGTQNISKLVKKQMKDNANWTIESLTLKGTDNHLYTYSYKKTKSYVMEPKEESILEAKTKIQALFKEEKE